MSDVPLSALPSDVADSVLAWLARRGRDMPVHIPLKTIKVARECFTVIDVDGSGTLEPQELQAVFQALGQPASLRQVTRLVESVAGAGARSLRFIDFAQMMHGAVSSKQREETELDRLMQEDAGALAGAGDGGGDGEPQEPALDWGDFHLLAKAFRRRVVINGVISDAPGWRNKVLALAERRAAASNSSAVSAAAVWKFRAQRLARTATPQAVAAPGGEADGCGGGPTPRGAACNPEIAVDDAEGQGQGRGQGSHRARNTSTSAAASSVPGAGPVPSSAQQQEQQGQVQAQQQDGQLSPIVQQLLNRLRANAAGAGQAVPGPQTELAGANSWRSEEGQAGNDTSAPACDSLGATPTADWLPAVPTGGGGCFTPAMSAFGAPAASEHGHALASEAGQEAGRVSFAQPGGLPYAAGGGGGVGVGADSAEYDWRRSTARMHLAAAASRQAVIDGCAGAALKEAAAVTAAAPAQQQDREADSAGASAGTATPLMPYPGGPRGTAYHATRLMAPTASSTGHAATGCDGHSMHGMGSISPAEELTSSSSGRSSRGCSGPERYRGKPVAQAQHIRLAALALVRGGR